MRNEYTLADAEKKWAEAGKYGDVSDRIERAKRWNQYYARQAEKLKACEFTPEQDFFMKHLMDTGKILKTDSILDIGAGGGRYALAFAGNCHSVTALDGCRENLELIRHRAKRLNLENISCSSSFWEEYRAEQTYDVTFCSMCPAICTREDILKMEQMTGRLCCVITVMKGSYDKHRMQMLKDLEVKTDGTLTDAIHYYNILYLMGRDPDVCCQDIHTEKQIAAEEILEQYVPYFRIFGISKETVTAYLEHYLEKNAKDGYLTEESRYRLAMITWNPNPVSEKK